MGKFHKYPHIELLHRVPDILLEREVVVTEKVHGINVRFGWVDGRFRVGSREEELSFEVPAPTLLKSFLAWILSTNLVQQVTELAKSLGSEFIFYGEWFGPGVQKGVVYAAEKQLRIFDVRVGEDFVEWDRVAELAARIDVKTMPVLYRGRPRQDVFDEKRIESSTIAFENMLGSAENIAEGIVIKSSRMHRNHRGNWVIAKHKSPAFSERKSGNEDKVQPTTPESATEFIEEFFTIQRLEHVLTNLRAAGVDVTIAAATGQILKGMYQDVMRESEPEYGRLDEESRKAVDRQHATKTKVLLRTWLIDQTNDDSQIGVRI